jgi:hypothetical protein
MRSNNAEILPSVYKTVDKAQNGKSASAIKNLSVANTIFRALPAVTGSR